MPATRPRPTAPRASTAPAGRARKCTSGCGSSCSPMSGWSGCPTPASRPSSTAPPTPSPRSANIPSPRLRPQLGVVSHKGREFVLADIPGLIEGAAEGAGIGDRFLGHVERTRVLLHLVDAAGEDPIEAYRVVRGELEAYGAGLEDKPEVLALSRADLVEPKDMAKLAKKLAKVVGGPALRGVGRDRRRARALARRDPRRGRAASRRPRTSISTRASGRRSEPLCADRRDRVRRRAPARPRAGEGHAVRALTRRPSRRATGVTWVDGALDDRGRARARWSTAPTR